MRTQSLRVFSSLIHIFFTQLLTAFFGKCQFASGKQGFCYFLRADFKDSNAIFKTRGEESTLHIMSPGRVRLPTGLGGLAQNWTPNQTLRRLHANTAQSQTPSRSGPRPRARLYPCGHRREEGISTSKIPTFGKKAKIIYGP